MEIETEGNQLKPGMKITIAGVRFGKEYPIGYTTSCKPGRETVLVVEESRPGPSYSVAPAIVAHRVAPLQHGPAKRKRW